MAKRVILQTDSIYGTFKMGDPHPFVSGRVFLSYKKNYRGRQYHEEWITPETNTRRKKDQARWWSKRYRVARGEREKKPRLQTGNPVGSFKYRDPHPSIADRFFLGYRKGTEKTERWASSSQLQATARISDQLKRERRKGMAKANPTHASLIDCIYDYRDRLNSIFGQGTFHVDHLIPVTKGGKHEPCNLQVVPAKWNMSKSNRHAKIWMTPYEES
jgi:hypothetical protein